MASSSNPTKGVRTDNDHTRHSDQNGASAVERVTAHDDDTMKNAVIGTDSSRSTSNVSWGSIIAGVVTFLALTVLLSMAAAAMGLNGASGTATGLWTVIALAVSLAAAGYVAGSLAARSGLFHGFLTWAASLLSVIMLAGWLGSSALGAIGGVVSTVSDKVNVSTSQVQDAAKQANGQIDQKTVDTAKQRAQEVADTTGDGMWWAFAGSLIGAGIAAAAGIAGARSVARKRTELTVRH